MLLFNQKARAMRHLLIALVALVVFQSCEKEIIPVNPYRSLQDMKDSQYTAIDAAEHPIWGTVIILEDNNWYCKTYWISDDKLTNIVRLDDNGELTAEVSFCLEDHIIVGCGTNPKF